DAELKAEAHAEDDCRRRLRIGKTALVVVPGPTLKYVYDPANKESLTARYWVDAVLVRAHPGQRLPPPEEKFFDEPGNRYIDFLMPGLLGMNIMGGGMFGVGFVLVDMRVRKLFKRLLATPMRRSDFLASLLVSRLVFMVPEVLVLLLVACLGYGVPLHGGLPTLIVVILVGSAAFSGIGLLCACRTEKTETISGLMNLVMLPMWILSGTFFSSRRFPDFMQPF